MKMGKNKITLVLHLNVLYKNAHSSEYLEMFMEMNL